MIFLVTQLYSDLVTYSLSLHDFIQCNMLLCSLHFKKIGNSTPIQSKQKKSFVCCN